MCACVYAAVHDIIPVDVIGDIIKLECQHSEEQHQISNYSSKYVEKGASSLNITSSLASQTWSVPNQLE